ncbi:MAG: hypothetical protein K8I60_09460 [Anaerolineae bacterium]|nr:hypothetical protein [Anaerolineae bacterium]
MAIKEYVVTVDEETEVTSVEGIAKERLAGLLTSSNITKHIFYVMSIDRQLYIKPGETKALDDRRKQLERDYGKSVIPIAYISVDSRSTALEIEAEAKEFLGYLRGQPIYGYEVFKAKQHDFGLFFDILSNKDSKFVIGAIQSASRLYRTIVDPKSGNWIDTGCYNSYDYYDWLRNLKLPQYLERHLLFELLDAGRLASQYGTFLPYSQNGHHEQGKTELTSHS